MADRSAGKRAWRLVHTHTSARQRAIVAPLSEDHNHATASVHRPPGREVLERNKREREVNITDGREVNIAGGSSFCKTKKPCHEKNKKEFRQDHTRYATVLHHQNPSTAPFPSPRHANTHPTIHSPHSNSPHATVRQGCAEPVGD